MYPISINVNSLEVHISVYVCLCVLYVYLYFPGWFNYVAKFDNKIKLGVNIGKWQLQQNDKLTPVCLGELPVYSPAPVDNTWKKNSLSFLKYGPALLCWAFFFFFS